jgi:hypothetical protein
MDKVREFHQQAQQLEERTVDRVIFGDVVSESSHQLEIKGASTTGRGMRGLQMHLPWRAGESFAFEMTLPRGHAATVWCRYFPQRYLAGNGPDIHVAGVNISHDKLSASLDAMPISGVVVEYAIPPGMQDGEGKVRVALHSTPPDLRITDLRVLRAKLS